MALSASQLIRSVQTASVSQIALAIESPVNSNIGECGDKSNIPEARRSGFFHAVRSLMPPIRRYIGLGHPRIAICTTRSYTPPMSPPLMPQTADRKDHPISMRLPEADIAMIDRAAGLRGRSRTDFVRDAAVRAAEDVLMDNRLIRMSPEGFDAFMAAVSGPATPASEMVEVARRAAPWESGAASKT